MNKAEAAADGYSAGARRAAGPLVLLIMDGVGEGLRDEFDAVWVARTPNLDALSRTGLRRSIFAHGPYVGLPSTTDMGNSEWPSWRVAWRS